MRLAAVALPTLDDYPEATCGAGGGPGASRGTEDQHIMAPDTLPQAAGEVEIDTCQWIPANRDEEPASKGGEHTLCYQTFEVIAESCGDVFTFDEGSYLDVL